VPFGKNPHFFEQWLANPKRKQSGKFFGKDILPG
jgi:hypothetical protein